MKLKNPMTSKCFNVDKSNFLHYYETCFHLVMRYIHILPHIEWEGQNVNVMHSGMGTCFVIVLGC